VFSPLEKVKTWKIVLVLVVVLVLDSCSNTLRLRRPVFAHLGYGQAQRGPSGSRRTEDEDD
jgi:hypothetical protein